MRYQTLIQAGELLRHLGEPGWRIVDCRFELSQPRAGRAAWRAGHVPGAVHADLEQDLSAPVTAGTGRHPLPDVATTARVLGRLGIGNDTQVVVYDAGPGTYAARLWWMLRWLGHDAVAVLDGGLAAWQAAGGPLDAESPAVATQAFTPRERPGYWVDAGTVARDLERGLPLFDARGPARFAGTTEPIDARAGHVPGARNFFYERNLGPDGRFLAPEELRSRWLAALEGADPATASCMCGSGVTACHNLLALEVAGLPGARLYAGSWSEWIRDPARPVAGPEAGSGN